MASCSATVVEHKEVGVVDTVPTSSTDVRSGWVAKLAGIIALKLGAKDEIVEFVHDVDLLRIPVSLNYETVTRFVIHGILYVFEGNIDLSTIVCIWCKIFKDLSDSDT
jgi:hypothetical protein